MIERNLLATLNKWAAKERRKPLVIRGARQVGKTTLVKEFSKQFIHFD
ncbi:MAG: AAA family ATPase [Muribaculaceae bacterium]|nr:AAA family ATPase [Muribaculaceae bacterium]